MRATCSIVNDTIFVYLFDTIKGLNELESAKFVQNYIKNKLDNITCGDLEQSESGIYHIEIIEKNGNNIIKDLEETMSKAQLISHMKREANKLLKKIETEYGKTL